MSAEQPSTRTPRVIALTRDLFFGMRIRNALRQMGYTTEIAKSEAELEVAARSGSVALALIDFNEEIDWNTISRVIDANPDLPVIAFGAHTDTEAFRTARDAGVTRVISNGAFSQQLPDLIQRYARRE